MYSAFDNDPRTLIAAFCKEAQQHWEEEKNKPSPLTMAAAQFLSFGHLFQGQNDSAKAYLHDASQMGVQLGLFSAGSDMSKIETEVANSEDGDAVQVSAWGVFNWVTYVYAHLLVFYCCRVCGLIASPLLTIVA